MVRNRWPSTNACHRSVGPWSRAVERIIHIESRPLKGAGNARCAIVERTAMRDEDFGTDLNLAVGDDGDWSPPEVIATQASRDWRSRFEQERARADAAEARAEELRCAEVDSRARAGSLKWQLDRSRSKGGPLAALCRGRSRGTERGPEGQACQAHRREEHAIEAHRGRSVAYRAQEIPPAEGDNQVPVPGDSPSAQSCAGVGATPDPGSQTSRGSDRGIEVSVDQVAALRKALRRSRLQKATIQLLRKENARLHKSAKMSRNWIETLEAGLARLRATGAVLSRTLYGRKSEKQETPRSGRPRGQQRGAPGHGRTQRPGLEERTEEHNPPADACVCARCRQPYAPNGSSPATTTSATRPWSAPRCATPSTTATAGRSLSANMPETPAPRGISPEKSPISGCGRQSARGSGPYSFTPL